MSFSINTVTSDGVETQFPVSFTNGIYDRNNVKVYVQDDVDGTGTPLERSFTWINDGIIELDVAAPAGKTVTLKRVMNKNEPDVNYVNGAILDESNLNQSLDQLLAIQHEILDGVGIESFNQDVDMNGYRLTNVGQGTQNTDGVNLQQLNAIIAASGTGLIASQREVQTGAQVSSLVTTFTGITYIVGGNNLYIFLNGNYQTAGVDYTETSASSITWLKAINSTDGITAITNLSTTNSTTDTSAITHSQSGTSYNLATYLQNRNVVSVQDFGADPSGATDSLAAFQSAIAVGSIVYVPKGTYKVSDTITIGSGDPVTRIIGEKSTVFSEFGVLVATKKILNASRAVDLEDIYWETDTTDSTGTAPSWDDLSRTFAYKAYNAGPTVLEGSTVRGCQFKNFERGLIVNGTNSLEFKTLVENNHFTENAGGNAGSTKLNQLGNVTFRNNTAYLGSECVFTSNTKLEVSGNKLFLPDKPAIDVGGSAAVNVEEIVIYGNISVGRDGIVCERGSNKTEIYGNVCIPTALTPNGVGIGVTGSVGAQGVQKPHIHGNTIYSYNNEDGTNGSMSTGVKVGIDGTGLVCEDINIHDNIVYDAIFGVQVKGYDGTEKASNAHIHNNKLMRVSNLGITTQYLDTVRTYNNYVVKKGTAYAAGTRGIGFNTVTDAQSKNDECVNWGAGFFVTDQLDEIEIVNPVLDKGSTVIWSRVVEEGTVNGGHVTVKGLEFDTIPTTGSVRAGSKISKYTLSEGQAQGWWCISDSVSGGLWSPTASMTGSVNKSTTFTVNATNDNGKKFSNFGAVGVIEADLPAGQAGLKYTFRRIANAAFRIDPNASESIRGGAAGEYLQLGANGDFVTLEWDTSSSVWEILEARGTLSYEP